MNNKYLIKYIVSSLRMRFREPCYCQLMRSISDRDVSRASLCVLHVRACVHVCVCMCKTMHIPPRSPVLTYQNGWPEEDGPPGERQYVSYIIYIYYIYICVCLCTKIVCCTFTHHMYYTPVYLFRTLAPTHAPPSGPSPKATIALQQQ